MILKQSENFTVKYSGNSDVIISGYASVFNVVDQHNDMIMPGSFTGSISRHQDKKHIKLLWQHDMSKPIGVIDSLLEDQHGLWIESIITNDTQMGREAIALVRKEFINGLSIGLIIKQSIFHNKGYKQITEADLWEVSIVTFPANQEAQIHYIGSKCLNDKTQSLTRFNAALDEANFNIKQLIGGNYGSR